MRRFVAAATTPFRDAFVGATLLAAGFVVAGFVCVLLAWRGSARLGAVPLQLPYLVSGGVLGVALVGSGLALLLIQATRREAARERKLLEDVTRAGVVILGVVQSEDATRDRRRRRSRARR